MPTVTPGGLDNPSPSLPVRMPCADLATACLLLLCVDGVYAQYNGKWRVWEADFCSRVLWLLSCGASCPGAALRLEQRCRGRDPG